MNKKITGRQLLSISLCSDWVGSSYIKTSRPRCGWRGPFCGAKGRRIRGAVCGAETLKKINHCVSFRACFHIETLAEILSGALKKNSCGCFQHAFEVQWEPAATFTDGCLCFWRLWPCVDSDKENPSFSTFSHHVYVAVGTTHPTTAAAVCCVDCTSVCVLCEPAIEILFLSRVKGFGGSQLGWGKPKRTPA